MNKITTQQQEVEQVVVPNISVGIMRSTGTYVGLLLQLEHPCDRIDILWDVMRKLGIPIADLADRFEAVTCKQCGALTSPLDPCECARVNHS